MSTLLKEVNNQENFKAIVDEGVVLVDFWAPWCKPCQMQIPILEILADSISESINILKVNIDESPDIAELFSIESIPTLVLFNNGNEVKRLVGLQTKETPISEIQNYLQGESL